MNGAGKWKQAVSVLAFWWLQQSLDYNYYDPNSLISILLICLLEIREVTINKIPVIICNIIVIPNKKPRFQREFI
jgi:hypothetical protein